jgi:hypothetical protein
VIEWIVTQDQCDRATAALALLRADISSLMDYLTPEACPAELRARWRIADVVCTRSEGVGYLRTGLELSAFGEENDQSGLLLSWAHKAEQMAEERRFPPWPLPAMLLTNDFVGTPPQVPYRVIDGDLVLLRERERSASVIDLTERIAAA